MTTDPKAGAEIRTFNADGWRTAAQVYSNLALSKSQEDNIKAIAEMSEGFRSGGGES